VSPIIDQGGRVIGASKIGALGAGYDLHLAKPVEPNDLARAVAHLVTPRQR
jgi:CheY-like chemotaxis protein